MAHLDGPLLAVFRPVFESCAGSLAASTLAYGLLLVTLRRRARWSRAPVLAASNRMTAARVIVES